MTRSPSSTTLLTTGLKYAALAVGAFVMLLPFAWMISSSFMTSQEIITRPLSWIPSDPSLDAYRGLRDAIPIGRRAAAIAAAGWMPRTTPSGATR